MFFDILRHSDPFFHLGMLAMVYHKILIKARDMERYC